MREAHRGRLGEESRQIDANRRALPVLTVDFHVSAGLFDEAVHLAEPKSGAVAKFFGRKEWLKGAIQHARRHAAAGIAHADQDVLTR